MRKIHTCWSTPPCLIAGAAWCTLIFGPTLAASAQTGAPAPAAAHTQSVGAMVAQMGHAAGMTVLADSTVSPLQITPPRAATTAANLDEQIAAITKQLPPGTQWAKLMLPAPPAGHSWRGDDVAQFAHAAARLYGMGVFSSSSMHTAANTGLSLLAQPIPVAKSSEYAADLHLQPVYVIANTNPLPSTASGNFTPMTDPQQIQDAISHLPTGEMRDHVLEEYQHDPNSVHIETDGNGGVKVEIEKGN